MVINMEKQNTAKNTSCTAAKKCGGCQLQNMTYPEQLTHKQKKVERYLGSFCKISPIIGMKNPYNYRKKVQAAYFTGRGRKILAGVYQSNSNSIIPVDNCMIQSAAANKIIETVRKMLPSYKLEPFDLRTGRGNLRHVLIREGEESGQIMVVLVTASPIFQLKKHFVNELVRRHPEITTIVHNVNKDYDGLMLGNFETVLYGKGWIEDSLCGLKFRISSRAFYQVNPIQARVLYEKAIEYAALTGKERVADAYCGVGTIGLIASKHAKQVWGIESNRDAIRDAIANSKSNNIKNVRFVTADAGEWMESLADAGESLDVVLLDPPRAGCSREFLDALVRLNPERLVYVSCNPETQARDLKVLKNAGYRAVEATPVDMFPFTNHIETVVKLVRQ